MNTKFNYTIEKNKTLLSFEISLCTYDIKKIRISISDLSSTNKIFSSNFELDDLNIKFMKVIEFKDIEKFSLLLAENIKKKKLVLERYYNNAISSTWKVFPDSKDEKQEQLTFSFVSSLASNKNISLIFYSNFKKSEKFVKEIEKNIDAIRQVDEKKTDNSLISEISYEDHWLIDNMYFLPNEYDNDEQKKTEDFIELYKKAIANIEKTDDKRILLVFFDSLDIVNNIKNILEKIYIYQPFILIFSDKDKEIFKDELMRAINEMSINNNNKDNDDNDDDDDDDDDEDEDNKDKNQTAKIDILPFVDMNNFFIYNDNEENYKKAIISLFKVYRYFNQLGDAYFKKLHELINIDILDENFDYLFHTHYFNILLCGRTGTGKSTFINKIMGEKSLYFKIQISRNF